ncbi:RNB domain-containing ribonuclease [Solirubrobacter phytolaccae]|uniref:RNB domain-containing ribonuclease n=1 Tax=Solirubrobacter phytolaccae TaxID=1404360 RepID=A0A9X3NHT2_9ACTN|nr:RNB domain-containing ribonuclease [Solirubrobacter phytolaccae]MDA0184166.1 RNB domain-containing ribonuclease [Solirubrobacter phytolaccae]
MLTRWLRVVPQSALADGLAAIRAELGVPGAFPEDALEEAEAAAAKPVEGTRVELPFITIDPPGARDLDQALHLARREDGYRVSYAIADPAYFLKPGGALDREAHERGATVYMPDGKLPLYPPALSEGAASLLPDDWRPAVLWTLDLDARGELVATHVARRVVRSTAQHTYEDVPDDVAPLLREIGELRLAIERARGGVRLAVPEQEVIAQDDGWTTSYRVPNAYEEFNAQLSLLTGMAAARLMLDARVGILRTQPAPSEKSFARFGLTAAALGVPWPEDVAYPEFVRALDPTIPAHAAVMHEASRIGSGAGYTAFDGALPELGSHWAVAAPYAHATAPLRRLQDRYVSDCCLGTPDREALPGLPATMAAAGRRAGAVDRAVVDLVEAVLLAGREGESFEAVVIDDGVIQLRDPAVRAKVSGSPAPGTTVTVRLERADPATRTVTFTL